MAKRHSSHLFITALLVFAFIVPPFMHICKCAVASGDKHALTETRPADSVNAPMPSCCCAGGCTPDSGSDPIFTDADAGSACDMHPVCCFAADGTPPSSVNHIIPENDQRQSNPRFQYQVAALPSSFMPETEPGATRPILAVDLKMIKIPTHIASTVLLL